MRIMTVARALERVGQLRPDSARIGAEHDHPVGEHNHLLDVVGDDQDPLRRELAGLPELEQLGAEVLGGEHRVR